MLLYALTILVSAFLLFQIQPLIAKVILPWFGGSAAVWTTCLLFFQVMLLLGYLYAYGISRARARTGAIVHVGLLAASLLFLPVTPDLSWKPSGAEDPVLRILALLAATLGLPYLLLSTTGPLVQSWFARRFKSVSPYRLYALSNAGSMFALVSYPVLFEPNLQVHQQAFGWSAGYAVFALFSAFIAWQARPLEPLPESGAERPGWRLLGLWIALPACASVLLLAVTNHLSQNVAAIPFLWVLPLSLYLLSFILAFQGWGWPRNLSYLQILAVAIGVMAYGLSEDFENTGVKVLVPLFCAGLFVCCLVCHGEVARLKPHPRLLTTYYLMIAVGGALGGVFVGLVGPYLFDGYYELQVGLVACALLALAVREQKWTSPAMVVPAALVVMLGVYLALQIAEAGKGYRIVARNFYGLLRVSDEGEGEEAQRKLTHGTINHGEQFLDPARRAWPTTYYGRNSGVGLAIQEGQSRGPVRVGVIGLGTGTLATYGRPGDYFRFYEINPTVIHLARTEFRFLQDSRALVDVALGDARLSLEREAPQSYDVLAVDAFSSDSIPVHLLTREAFALYLKHLEPGGVLAVHISNKYLDLEPVLAEAMRNLRAAGRVVDSEDDEETGAFGSTWVLLTSRPSLFAKAEMKSAADAVHPKPGLRLWTDDYSNLVQILK